MLSNFARTQKLSEFTQHQKKDHQSGKIRKTRKIQKRKVANSLELSIKDRTAEELKVTKIAKKRVRLVKVPIVCGYFSL